MTTQDKLADYVLVPREPTEAMIEAGFRWHGLAAYKAMIAAAPDAPAPVQPPANGDVDLEKVELWVANNCYDPVIEKTLFAAIAALQQPGTPALPEVTDEDVQVAVEAADQIGPQRNWVRKRMRAALKSYRARLMTKGGL